MWGREETFPENDEELVTDGRGGSTEVRASGVEAACRGVYKVGCDESGRRIEKTVLRVGTCQIMN